MNDLRFLKNNIYRETYYETTRKGKLFLKNDPRLVVGVQDLLLLLRGISITYVQLRFFFVRFASDKSQDLLENYPEKFLTAVLLDALVRNLPLTIKNVFTDHNTFIFDICIEGANSAIRTILQELLLREPVAYISRIEVYTKGEEELFFLLEGRHNFEPSHSILPQHDMYDVIPPLPRQVPVTLEVFDKFHQLLAQYYPIFFYDVKNRFCTIWCAQDGRGSYTVKRHVGGVKVVFPPTFEEAEALFQIEQIVQVVPNLVPETVSHPQEIVIDLDIDSSVPYSIVKQVSDRFAEWLVLDQGLLFHRRVTGSLRGGQHFILPVHWTYPAILAGKVEVWEVYNRRSAKHILCDSARDAAELLCLLFQIQNPTLAPFCTTRIFHPYSRYKRILFDVGSNSMNRGRRALLSLHCGSLHFVFL
jgi:hypothetical protein